MNNLFFNHKQFSPKTMEMVYNIKLYFFVASNVCMHAFFFSGLPYLTILGLYIGEFVYETFTYASISTILCPHSGRHPVCGGGQ